MAHDLIIRGGDLLDGSGAAAVRADVAIDGERITAVGDLSGVEATTEIDASGKVVTPGFVDMHTHLDAQVAWDPQLRSSSWHGVTTVLMGNCGVTFAPLKPADRDYLATLMESVEDIPAPAILDGLPWNWESYGGYLDAISEMNPSLNMVGLVGHSATRYLAMGERSMDKDANPTADELAIMRDVVGQAVDDGAVGFSTSRLIGHRTPDGRDVPGTHAEISEYEAILGAVMNSGGGIFQAVLDFVGKVEHEQELLRRAAELGCQVLFSGGAPNEQAASWWGRFFSDIEANGGRIASVTLTRPSGSMVGLAGMPPVFGREWLRVVRGLRSYEDKVAALKDPVVLDKLLAEADKRGTWYDPQFIYPLGVGDVPDFGMDGNVKNVAQLAEEAGVSPTQLIIDRLLASDGRELFNVWFYGRDAAAVDAYQRLPQVIPTLGDAGAHVSQFIDADSSTFLLSQRVRDRGVMPLPEAIRKLTSLPASVLGLIDRGTVEPGKFADINVIDYQRLETTQPELVHDFPHDAPRLIVRAKGYAATLVNGTPILLDDELTGARPGEVQRTFKR